MNESIIIFDGVCNFCNAVVNFILARDKKNVFRFAANQSEAAKQILSENNIPLETEISTVFVYENGKLYQKSTAALRIARKLPFAWNLCYIGIIIPAFLRNVIYDFIAKNRYKWFGKKETCRVPSPAERGKFLT